MRRYISLLLFIGLAWGQDCTADDGTEGVELWGNCYSIEYTNSLNLTNSGLTGEIPPEIGELINLTYLNLGDNALEGSIPPEIGNLTNLEYLSFYNNQLTGSILPEIGNLTNLKFLGLSINNLEGKIPQSFSGLMELTYINVSNNNLGGEFLEIMEKLPKLDNADFSRNKWYECMPIFMDPKCGDYTRLDTINTNIKKYWDGTFLLKKGSRRSKYELINGTFIEWYSDTNMKTEVLIGHGILRKFNHWDKDGTQLIKDGNGVFREYWYDEVLVMEGGVKDGLLNGEWKFYYGGGTERNPEDINLTIPIRLPTGANNQLIAVVDYDNTISGVCAMEHENWFDFIPSGGVVKEWYYESGQLLEKEKDDGYIKYFADGTVWEEYGINEDGNYYFNNYGSGYAIYGHKVKYSTKSILIDGEWFRKCFDGDIECESFSIIEKWDGTYCECD